MPATVAAVADAVSEQLEAMKVETLARWRGWVADVARGKKPPKPEEILSAAAILEISKPGEAFDEDVSVAIEALTNEKTLAKCKAYRDELLAPWGGDIEALRAAVAEAEAAAKALRDALGEWDRGCGTYHYENNLHTLRRRNPRALGGDA